MEAKLKKASLAILSLFAIGSFGFDLLYAEVLSKAAEKHLAEIRSYEQQMENLDRLIKEHEQKKKDYPSSWVVDPKLTPDEPEVRWMNKHCDEIIHNARKTKENLLEMAQWHRRKAVQPEEPLAPVSRISEMRLSVSDHSGWAKEYEARAAEQEDIIAEHEQAKQKYADNSAQQRCDAIIENAGKLKNDFREFSKWHRMQSTD